MERTRASLGSATSNSRRDALRHHRQGRPAMSGASAAQIGAIHALASRIGLTEAERRAFIARQASGKTCAAGSPCRSVRATSTVGSLCSGGKVRTFCAPRMAARRSPYRWGRPGRWPRRGCGWRALAEGASVDKSTGARWAASADGAKDARANHKGREEQAQLFYIERAVIGHSK